jgi:hypothetical protein
MFAKSILGAAAVAASVLLVQTQAAEAGKKDVDVDINLGIGGGYYGPGYPVYPGYPGVVVAPGKLSCWQGVKRVQYRGFYNVKPMDCSGRSYSYRGRRGGDVFRISVNAYTGRVTSIRPLY